MKLKNILILMLSLLFTLTLSSIVSASEKDFDYTYNYLSEEELKEHGWSPIIAKSVNDFNREKFSVYNDNGKEVDVYLKYNKKTINNFREIELLLEYYNFVIPNKVILDNISDFEFMLVGDIEEDLVYGILYDKYLKKYEVYDEKFNLINGKEVYGENKISQLPKLKKKFVHLSNKEILDNIGNNKNLTSLNIKNCLKYKVVSKGKVINAYDLHGQYIMQYFKNEKYKYKYLTNSEFLEIFIFGDVELNKQNTKMKKKCITNNTCKTSLYFNK